MFPFFVNVNHRERSTFSTVIRQITIYQIVCSPFSISYTIAWTFWSGHSIPCQYIYITQDLECTVLLNVTFLGALYVGKIAKNSTISLIRLLVDDIITAMITLIYKLNQFWKHLIAPDLDKSMKRKTAVPSDNIVVICVSIIPKLRTICRFFLNFCICFFAIFAVINEINDIYNFFRNLF